MNSLKSIATRYASIKAKGFDEKDGTKANEITKALAKIGISAVDSKGKFRDFTAVVDELGGKWDKLDVKSQRYVSTVFAGKLINACYMW